MMMIFDKENYTIEKLTLEGRGITFRAFRNIVYVDKPAAPEYQQMNIFVRESLYEDLQINGYTLKTAPIFMPNPVRGYLPGELAEPGYEAFGSEKRPNLIFKALERGYVVVTPALRGRTLQDKDNNYIGKAPACIVDYKAAVRFLKHFSRDLPGDTSKIITNGTGAGGALSALMGTSGNHADYKPYLEEIGAAKASDAVFAASCYCPTTNLDHADEAYEWQFKGVNSYNDTRKTADEAEQPAFTPITGNLTAEQIKISNEEAALFHEYLNPRLLRNQEGELLELDANGEGSFKEHIKQIIIDSAQTALDKGIDVAAVPWLTVEDNQVVALDFEGYVTAVGRRKTPPAFDALDAKSPENSLFGTEATDCRHFTKFSQEHSQAGAQLADEKTIKMLNAMYYVGDDQAYTSQYWRIRQGAFDQETTLAISAMLAGRLVKHRCDVDYQVPWETPHAGDYDLEELFDWIDGVCRKYGE